jgi:hypothetical protein
MEIIKQLEKIDKIIETMPYTTAHIIIETKTDKYDIYKEKETQVIRL